MAIVSRLSLATPRLSLATPRLSLATPRRSLATPRPSLQNIVVNKEYDDNPLSYEWNKKFGYILNLKDITQVKQIVNIIKLFEYVKDIINSNQRPLDGYFYVKNSDIHTNIWNFIQRNEDFIKDLTQIIKNQGDNHAQIFSKFEDFIKDKNENDQDALLEFTAILNDNAFEEIYNKNSNQRPLSMCKKFGNCVLRTFGLVKFKSANKSLKKKSLKKKSTKKANKKSLKKANKKLSK
jgi:hypothetical protein